MDNFYTRVIKNCVEFGSVDRVDSITLLEPIFRTLAIRILEELNNPAYRIIETFRSKVRQRQLFFLGRTSRKTVGVHHYGLACDFAYIKHGIVSPDLDDYKPIGELAEKYCLVWGGRWKHPVDGPHIQRCSIADQPALFNGKWYPDDNYKPI